MGKGCEIGKGLIAGEGDLANTRQGGQQCVLSQQRQGSNTHKGNIECVAESNIKHLSM
jgi:hypothetical protein